LTQNPILKVLSTFKRFEVKSLVIGGQACIIYGAAEFSKDSDFIALCDAENLARLRRALRELKARNIYVPPLKKDFLDRGHACHFRCHAEAVKNLRVDVLAKLRGCGEFEQLWQRRSTVTLPDKSAIEVIGLQDLVKSKKTQRDKDWLMLRRLVENDIAVAHRPLKKKTEWWLHECRSVRELIRLAHENGDMAQECVAKRPLLKAALEGDSEKLRALLIDEELVERQKDKEYWLPLRKELEALRHTRSENK
jgi:hypothetical protein